MRRGIPGHLYVHGWVELVFSIYEKMFTYDTIESQESLHEKIKRVTTGIAFSHGKLDLRTLAQKRLEVGCDSRYSCPIVWRYVIEEAVDARRKAVDH